MGLNIERLDLRFLKKIKEHKYISAACLLVVIIFGSWLLWQDAVNRYETLLSDVMYDRNMVPLSIAENGKGHYVHEASDIPEDFKKLLIKKEDRFFYYHLGVNPISTIRAVFNSVIKGRAGGSSTLTQQLAKNLLETETDRNVLNKLIETLYAVSIEIFASKEKVLIMYANSAYLGNQVQGFDTASYAYFNKPLKETTHSEKISLLATLSYPSARNPWAKENEGFAQDLNNRISPSETYIAPETTDEYSFQKDSSFELRTAGVICDSTCTTTVDNSVTEKVREILNRHIVDGFSRNIRNGAVVVIDPKNEELIAMVGSRNPNSGTSGNQINMALEPRPIGSTVKPFIYAKGFEMGLRPYSIVEDREYKYPIATGFSLYPKNYDGQYRGEVTLHEALSNSLNVPSVKTLEFIGLDNFYTFLSDDLKFEPIQDYDSYQYGIALGGLEMDLTTLTHYFTLFPRKGTLAPLQILKSSNDNFDLPPQSHIEEEIEVVSEEYIELVHAIISDRFTGVNQFGLEGNLNISHDDYGVKTGTSRDFHDSWVVGYTGDFVVGVWLGNSENEPLDQVSGSSGAGLVWHDVMEYLLSTDYNRETGLELANIERLHIDDNDEWTLRGDKVLEHQNLLLKDNLILSIHPGDVFELSDNLVIPLHARRTVEWSVNGQSYGTSQETNFTPDGSGTYEITAFDNQTAKREIVLVKVTLQE